MKNFRRILMMLIGYLAACLATAFVLSWAYVVSANSGSSHPLPSSAIFFSTPIAAIFVVYYAFLPSAAVIFCSEIFARKEAWFYAVAGGVAGLLVSMAFALPVGSSDPYGGMMVPGLAGAGAVGGLAYWLVAGRNAGAFITGAQPAAPPAAPTSPEP